MRGIVAVLLAMAFFVLSDSVVKLAGETLPVTQIMALRGQEMSEGDRQARTQRAREASV